MLKKIIRLFFQAIIVLILPSAVLAQETLVFLHVISKSVML